MRTFALSRLNPFAPSKASGETRLGRRSIYILPSREGIYFGAVLIVMLLAAINYANGLAYILTFLLGSIGIVAILQTHRNLSGMRLSAGNALPVFAGETATFRLTLGNDTPLPRYAVDVGIASQVYRTDVPACDSVTIEIAIPTAKRGYLDAPPVKARTRFPLGLWHAWSRPFLLPMRCLVYPTPAPTLEQQLPEIPGIEDAGEMGRRMDGDDFTGLREFHPGDSIQRVAWKKVAAGQGWYTKQFASGTGKTIWLEWEALAPLNEEERLSILCRWVLMAEQQGLAYGMRLPNMTLAPAAGEVHRARCLEALALFPARS